jgi:hypothetical protein
LGIIDDILDVAGPSPVMVLATEDMQRLLSELLTPNIIAARDHELPGSQPALELPILLLCGIDVRATRVIFSGMKSNFPDVRSFYLYSTLYYES